MHSYPVSDTKFLGLFSAKVWIVRGFYGGARIVIQASASLNNQPSAPPSLAANISTSHLLSECILIYH